MTEPKDKVRICDLKPGDEFILWGLKRKVIKVNGSVYFNDRGKYSDERNRVSAGSKQWVELIKKA